MDLIALQQHLKDLAAKKPLEGYCTFCGDCCHLSVKIKDESFKGRILVKDLPCRFLVSSDSNPESFRCSVYPDRFEKAPWCQSLGQGLVLGLYTSRCGYVPGLGGYEGPTEVSDHFMYYVLPYVLHQIQGYPDPFLEEDVQEFVRKWNRG